ncbi:MAG TPA: ABC transporter permease [Planctomycetota bacterium]|nr:ABC transporter permease [Planctomycetota bacterium]
MNRFWMLLAMRTLLRRRARSGITLAAVSLGVGILVFLGAVMTGVDDTMVRSTVAAHSGHVTVRPQPGARIPAREFAERWSRLAPPGCAEFLAPRAAFGALLVGGRGTASVEVLGLLVEREGGRTVPAARLVSGRLPDPSAPRPEICLGALAAERLGAAPGDTLRLRLQDGDRGPVRVAGVFRTGIERMDAGTALMALGAALEAGGGALTAETAVFARDRAGSDELLAALRPMLAAGEEAVPWQERLPDLDELIRLNHFSMLVFIALVTVLLATAVSNTALISVLDRYRALGVLKALGARPSEIVRLVMFESAVLTLAAGAAGLLLGALATLVAARTGIDLGHWTSRNPHFVLSTVIHPRLTAAMTFGPAAGALGASLLATLWPALTAARGRVADVLRMAR